MGGLACGVLVRALTHRDEAAGMPPADAVTGDQTAGGFSPG